MQMLVHVGLLCMEKILKLFILTVSELNVFLKKWKFVEHKSIKKNMFRIQAITSVMCGYFRLAGKTLIDYTSLMFSYDFEKMII